MIKKNHKIIICAGGTGGHIFPGLEIGKELAKNKIDVLFVGALNKMEMEKIPKAGFPILGLWIQGWYRKSIIKNIFFPIKLICSFVQSIYILYMHQPSAIIGTGGFVTGPILFVGGLLGYKIYIQEQNAYPGVTNRLLSRFAKIIFVAHSGMNKFFPLSKLFNFGNPVRKNLNIEQTSQASKLYFNLDQEKFTILVTGGSLGAAPINEYFKMYLTELVSNGCQLIWQTGKKSYWKYKFLNSDYCKIHPFIEKMDLAYNAADVVVSRSGAISISEICFLSKASILIPSPYVAEDHQKVNAEYLQNNNACLLVEEKELFQRLMPSIIQLKDKMTRDSIRRNAHKLFKYNAAKKISTIILDDIES